MTLKFKAKYILLVSFAFIGVAFSHDANAGTIIKAPAYLGLQGGLVGHWTFDGADIGTSGTIAKDKSGNGNNGTITGALLKQGRVGQALDFDGTDDWVDAGSNTVLDNLPVITASAWINPDVNENLRIFSKSGGAESGWYFDVYDQQAIQLVVQYDGGSHVSRVFDLAPSGKVLTGRWTHIVAIWDGSTTGANMRLFADGVEITDSLGGPTNGTGGRMNDQNAALMIGARSDTGSPRFNGRMDEMRIYNRILSSAEIARLYRIGLGSTANRSNTTSSLQKGLVGQWTFDGADIGTSGTIAKDKSGNGNNGTITGALLKQGKIGQSLDFNGTTDYVNAGSATSLANIASISVSAWIKPRSLGEDNNGIVIEKDFNGANTSGWSFYISNYGGYNNIEFFMDYSGASDLWVIADSNYYALNQWYHVTVTWNGTSSGAGVKMYMNGLPIGTTVVGNGAGSRVTDVAENLNIGGDDGASTFDGLIDDVKLYNRVLSAGEVARLYNQTQSKFNSSKTDVLTNGLVGHWTFDGADISGTRAKDKSGGENHGTISGATKAKGKVGQALSFDGVDDRIDFGDVNALDGISRLSVSAWIKNDSLAQGPSVVSKYSSSEEGWGMILSANGSGGDDIEIRLGFSDFGLLENVHQAGRWELWTMVYDGTETGNANKLKFYLNGTYQPFSSMGGTIPATVPNTSARLCISSLEANSGDGCSNSRFWDGLIDEVRIYNRALSASEVNKLYQMGR